MPLITSLQNARVKDAIKLRDRRAREKQGRVLIDGARELRRAMEAQIELHELFVCRELCHSEDADAVLELADDARAEVLEVTPPVFEKLAFGERAEGVLGVARPPQRTLADLQVPENPLVAVLEGVEKPGNVGAVLRSADAAGVSAVVVADGGTDLYNPNTIRASLGTIFAVPVCGASSRETLAWLRVHGLHIVTSRVDAAIRYTAAPLAGPTAIVLGAESFGLSEMWRGDDVTEVSLPMLGVADSLNVSTTAAVLFYEALRQRANAGNPM